MAVGDKHLAWSAPSPRLHLATVTSEGSDWLTARLECERAATAVLTRTEWHHHPNLCSRCERHLDERESA